MQGGGGQVQVRHRNVGAVQHVPAVQVQRPELDVQLRQRGPAAAEGSVSLLFGVVLRCSKRE